MSVPPLVMPSLKDVASHVLRWLVNLRRAGVARQEASLQAVNKVVVLARKTAAYARGLADGHRHVDIETELAASWAELGFELEGLGLQALAKKCDVTSRYWANPSQFQPGFLDQADIRLDTVEREARALAVKVRSGRAP